MHAVWDMPITIGAEIYLTQVLMVVMSWIVIFVLIANSLSQLGRLLRNETHIHIA
jgi:RsiW-degrading membrane proteinase PrsW (M82 family)